MSTDGINFHDMSTERSGLKIDRFGWKSFYRWNTIMEHCEDGGKWLAKTVLNTQQIPMVKELAQKTLVHKTME